MLGEKGYLPQQIDDLDGDVTTATKTKASDEEFVLAWMESKSYTDMTLQLGATVSAVQARATRLRKAGVKLPSFTRAARKRKEVNVTGLNNLIERE